MNPYIWCVVGALLGGLAGLLMRTGGQKTVVIENLLVGIFGAYIGGDFVAAMLNKGVINDKVFSMGSLGLSVAGAVISLVLLHWMRRAVGPLRPGKKRKS